MMAFGTLVYGYYARKRKVLFQKLKMNELRQQALAANMNPHFIFNSLNSIQHYINANKDREANEYLVSFSRLVRMNLESWQSGTVSLKDELDRLEIYLSLEKMRHSDMFDFSIEIDPKLNTFDCVIPPMLLQPYAENAVIHGLSKQAMQGMLTVRVRRMDEKYYLIELDDNGVGIHRAVKTKESDHKSLALAMNEERLKLFKDVNALDFAVEIVDKSTFIPSSQGTVVRIKLPNYF
jgi:LytS/YehU family sensor histidine kinase